MTVTHIEYPRKSKLYTQGLIDGLAHALDSLYEDDDSPWVYKNRHPGIKHAIELLESITGYYEEMRDSNWADYEAI